MGNDSGFSFVVKSYVQILSLICGNLRWFRFVVNELGSDFEPNKWPS